MRCLILTIIFFTFGELSYGQTGGFNIKIIQKTLVKINDSLYASKFEVTNKQYKTFLNFLKQNNQTDKYEIARIDSTKWEDKLTYNKVYAEYYHSHPTYGNYPVVNISYKGATLFCEWLTKQYNSDKKRKFQKVKFSLPTEQEWTIAAKGGNPSAIYPWHGTTMTNKDGFYRCNFKHYKKGNSIDVTDKFKSNADIIAPSASYWPNDFGLYNMSGNVAEMLIEKGKIKGGSWQDTAEHMKIDGENTYISSDMPMPTIGFRYFMEVRKK